MKHLVKPIIIIYFVFLPSMAISSGVEFYVTQNGNGVRDGRSPSTAWAVSDFNALKGTGYAGDKFYFSGKFSTRVLVNVEGTSTGQVTLDGFQNGECDPLHSECTSSALLEKGMDVGNELSGPDYITIQDFKITNKIPGKAGLMLFANNSGNDDQAHIDNTIIRKNFIYETVGPMFYWYGGRYNIIEDNKFLHFGQNGNDPPQGVNLINLENTLIRRNLWGHNQNTHPSGCTSANLIEIHESKNLLFEYNEFFGAPNQAGMNFKEYGIIEDIIVRFNKIHSNGQDGIMWGGGDDIHQRLYCYGNYIYDNKYSGISCLDNGDYAYIWSNLIHNNHRYGYGAIYRGYGSERIDNIWVINNTFARNGFIDNPNWIDKGAIILTNNGGTNYNIKNNIFYDNLPSGNYSQFHHFFEVINDKPIMDYNTIYHSLSSPKWRYDGVTRNIDYMKSKGLEVNSISENPMHLDPDGVDNIPGTEDDNYSLQKGSKSINSGVDLSQCFFVNLSGGNSWFEELAGYGNVTVCIDDGLDPSNTDWINTPPKVTTLKRDTYGWSRGAYIFLNSNDTGGNLEKPRNVRISNIPLT